MTYENFPAELRDMPQWVCFMMVASPEKSKPDKVPINPRTLWGARPGDPTTWGTMREALDQQGKTGRCKRKDRQGEKVTVEGTICGIGFMFNGNGIVGIDFDHCYQDGQLAPWVGEWVKRFDSYTEFSPSGTGLHILCRGRLPGRAIKLSEAEMYDQGRFFTVTGNGPAKPLCEAQEAIDALYAELSTKKYQEKGKPTQCPVLAEAVTLEDTELIEKAKAGKNGAIFAALWAGDTSGYSSHSEADMALCNALAWWTNGDAGRVDRLFRQSGLMREKWNERHGRDTYGWLTVENAVVSCRGGYDPTAYRKQEEAGAFSPAVGGGYAFAPFEPFTPPDTSKLPAFPVECLPPVLRDMAQAAAVNLQVAVDMTAVAGLAVVALCVQGKFIINPKPGWLEQLNLYAAVVARPSDRKTPALDLMSRPVYAFEKEENERRAPLVEEYRTKREVLSKRIANLKELAAKPTPSKGKPVTLDDITELQYELADLEREAVKPLRLLADDTTPEALASLMAVNDGKMGIVSDEGGVFDILAGKYSNGKANMDVFLKSYTGAPLRIDRKGRPPETIDHPTLTMLLMVQPVVLEAIMGNHDFAGRGFLARPLYALPVSTVGHRAYNTPPVPPQVEEAYHLLVDKLLSVKDLGEARIIRITPEAHQEAERFFYTIEPRLVDDLGDLDDLEGWGGKYHGQVMRIAGVLHCCIHGQEAAQVPLTVETMRAAETIGEYFLAHARAAFQIMGITEGQDTKDAKYILKRLEADGRTEISKRDLYDLCKGRLTQVEDMGPGLRVLVERGYIAIETIKNGRRGRPTEKVRINPLYQK